MERTHYVTKKGIRKRMPLIRLTRDDKEAIYAYVKSIEFDEKYTKII